MSSTFCLTRGRSTWTTLTQRSGRCVWFCGFFIICQTSVLFVPSSLSLSLSLSLSHSHNLSLFPPTAADWGPDSGMWSSPFSAADRATPTSLLRHAPGENTYTRVHTKVKGLLQWQGWFSCDSLLVLFGPYHLIKSIIVVLRDVVKAYVYKILFWINWIRLIISALMNKIDVLSFSWQNK